MSIVFPPGRWTAHWIWADDPAPQDGRRYVAFRRTLTLDRVPASVPTRVCADSRYVLSVNAIEVGRGPVRINPRRRRYDVVDLAPYLVDGDNVVTVLACFYGSATAWWMPAPTLTSAIRAGAFVFEADLGGEWLVSDSTWDARLLAGWRNTQSTGGVSGRGREVIEVGDLYADEWHAAVELSGFGMGEPGPPQPPNNPHGPFDANRLNPPSTADAVLTGGPAYRADRVVAGTVVFDVEGPAGAELSFTTSEFVTGGETIGGSLLLDGARRLVETFDTYGLVALHVEAPAGVVVHDVRVRERLYPVVGEAFFACSDPALDEIWSVGRRTVSICSFDAYIDCPTREQRAWTGDSVVHQSVDLATNGDWGLARWHPLLAAEPRPDGMLPMAVAGDAEHHDIAVIPDWALHWIHSVHNLYRYVGDAEEIRRLLLVAEGVLRWFDPFIGADGLLVDVVGWVIIDWASVYTEGVSASLNGLWARALVEFAEMAAWLGDNGRAGWARAVHAKLAVGFEQLWDPARRRYVDSMVGGVQRPMASQHGQAAAIVGRVAAESRWPRLVEVLADEADLVHATFSVPDREAIGDCGPPGGAYLRTGHPAPWWDVERQVVRAQPFFRYVVHDAIADAGRADLIAGLCRDWDLALRRCATSWTETWFGGTVSHGWSSTPTRDLTTRVLGIAPAAPGFAEARVEPALGHLEWARGAAPCPAGWIKVDVTHDALVVDSPIPFTARGARHEAGHHVING